MLWRVYSKKTTADRALALLRDGNITVSAKAAGTACGKMEGGKSTSGYTTRKNIY